MKNKCTKLLDTSLLPPLRQNLLYRPIQNIIFRYDVSLPNDYGFATYLCHGFASMLSRDWIFLYNGWTPPAVTGMLPQTRPPFYLNRIEWGQRTVIVNVIGGRMRNEPSPGRLPGP